MVNSSCKLLIIYGSQTGQAKSIAEDVKLKAEANGYDVQVFSMDESVKQMPWKAFRFVIFITSSTGDGDPPENAPKFWREMRNKKLSENYLSTVEYALLGLGDTNYTTFLGFPKSVERQLNKMGAKQFYKSGWADDAVGLEIVVDPWIEGLWPELIRQLKEPHTHFVSVGEVTTESPTSISSASQLKPSNVIPEQTNPEVILKDNVEVEKYLDGMASLKISVAPLCECDLKIPILPQPFLDLKFNSDLKFEPDQEIVLKSPMPSSKSPVFSAGIKSIAQLTSAEAVKTTLEVVLDLSKVDFEYQPGDAIGVYSSNNSEEVDLLLKRLDVYDRADVPCEIKVKEELVSLRSGTKAKFDTPAHIPTVATLRFIFTYCCEIRSVPRKPLIRILADCASAESDKRRLLELCSMQGSEDYTNLIRQPNLNILDLLNSFPSCKLPVERLLEQLPRLLARPYSICSSPLKDLTSASFILNIVEFSCKDGRTYERKGVATGGFFECFEKLKKSTTSSMANQLNMPIYLRTNMGFQMPENLETPLILIGPGTGVAPFLGFIAHREELIKRNHDLQLGPLWLLYGCRSKEQDYLYRNELERWHSLGILTKLLVCFSRDGSSIKYVQDLIQMHKSSLVKLIDKGGKVYVCGDANNMAKDVMQAIVSAFQSVRGISEEEAKAFVLQLQKDKRYLQDIWT